MVIRPFLKNLAACKGKETENEKPQRLSAFKRAEDFACSIGSLAVDGHI